MAPRMLYDYECGRCGDKEEALVPMGDRDGARACPSCGGEMKRIVSPVHSWVKDDGRAERQLRAKAAEHNRRIHRGEVDPLANDSGISSDPVWRNRTRAKNSSNSTIEKFKNAHVGWSDEQSKPGSLQVGSPPADLKR